MPFKAFAEKYRASFFSKLYSIGKSKKRNVRKFADAYPKFAHLEQLLVE